MKFKVFEVIGWQDVPTGERVWQIVVNFMTVGSIPGMGSIPNPGPLSYDRGKTKTAVRAETGLARSNMRACGHRIQPPGVTQRGGT